MFPSLFSFWSGIKTLLVTPSVSSSSSDQTSITAYSSAFTTNPPSGDTHYSSQWQLSTTNDFASIFRDSGETTSNKTSYTFTSLSTSTTYYMRVRHKGTNLGWTEYSTGVSKATTAAFASVPSITSHSSGENNITFYVSGYQVSPSGYDNPTSSRFQLFNSSQSLVTDTGNISYQTSYNFTSLSSSTQYYAKVGHTSSILGFTGMSSSFYSASTNAPYVPPPPPTPTLSLSCSFSLISSGTYQGSYTITRSNFPSGGASGTTQTAIIYKAGSQYHTTSNFPWNTTITENFPLLYMNPGEYFFARSLVIDSTTGTYYWLTSNVVYL